MIQKYSKKERNCNYTTIKITSNELVFRNNTKNTHKTERLAYDKEQNAVTARQLVDFERAFDTGLLHAEVNAILVKHLSIDVLAAVVRQRFVARQVH